MILEVVEKRVVASELLPIVLTDDVTRGIKV